MVTPRKDDEETLGKDTTEAENDALRTNPPLFVPSADEGGLR